MFSFDIVTERFFSYLLKKRLFQNSMSRRSPLFLTFKSLGLLTRAHIAAHLRFF